MSFFYYINIQNCIVIHPKTRIINESFFTAEDGRYLSVQTFMFKNRKKIIDKINSCDLFYFYSITNSSDYYLLRGVFITY